MPYKKEPPWVRWTEEVIHIGRYLALGVSGIVAVFAASTAGLVYAGYFIAAFCLVALGGVITRRYHFELIALYFLSSAVCMASFAMFASDFMTVGWLVFSLVPFLAERMLYLHLIAVDARKRAREKQ